MFSFSLDLDLDKLIKRKKEKNSEPPGKNSFVPSTDPRLARLRKHASSPAAWFRNPVATVVVVGGDDSDDWKRGGSGVSGSGGNSNNNDLPAAARPSSLPSPSSSSGRAAARAVAERAADPLAGPGDWCILYVPPNRGEQRASRGSNGEGGSAATTTEGEGAPSSSSSSNTPTAAAAASAVDSVASSKAALRMFSTLRAEFSTRRHERCVRVSDDDGRGNSSSSSVAAVGPVPSSAALSSVSFSLPPAWATQLARLLAAAASQALAARSEAYSKAGRALAAASSAERAAAAAEEGKGARAKAARGTSSSPSRPSFAPLFLAKDSRAAMLSASGMTDDAIAEYAELEALHSSYFDGVEEAERGDGESSPSASASTSASSTFADDATAAFAAPWSETRRAALRASSSKNTKGSSDSSFFLESLGVRQGVFARRAALLSGSGRHAELADAGARFVASVSAALGDERRRRTRRRRGKVESSPAPDPSLLALLPEAWTASACIALAEAAVRRPREMRELVEARREALAPSEGRGERRRGRGGSWGLALGGEDGASPPPPPPPLSPTDPLGRALAARAGDLYLAARDELGKLLLLVAAPNAAGDASPPLPLPSFSSSLRSVPSQPHPLSSAAAAASLAGGGSVAGLSPSPTRGRGAAAGGGGSDISRSAVVIARTGTGTGISSGGSDGHLVATAGAAAGGGGVLMSVASLSRASPLPQTSDAAAAAGAGAGSEGRASAASGENGKATSSVAGSDGGASSSSQQQQPATATAAPAAAAASGGGGTIRPFLARAAELRFRSSTSTAAAAAAAAADISVSGASTAAVAASSVADWASDPSAIEAEIESEGEEGRGKGENGDGDSGGDEETAATAATAPRASSSSSSPSSPSRLPPPWVTDPRLRLALSAPSDEGAALWLALSKAAAAAYRISGRTRRAAAAAASSAAAAAATGDPVGAQKALREEVALACGERWDRLSAAVLPALLEMRGGGSDNDEGERGETDRDEERGTAVSPETALAALSLRDGLLPLRARQRAQAALAEAAEGRGRRGGAEAATEPPSVPLDGGTALTVLPVPGAFSRMVLSRNYSAAGSAAAPLLAPAPGAAAAGAGAGAVLCAVGDDDAILQVDVASRLPHPLERVRPVLRLSLQQEVVVDSASSSPRAAFPVVPSPAASAKDVGGGGGGPAARFSAEWRETDVVECHRLVSSSPSPSPSSPSLVELAPGAKTRLRFALCPLASGAYALKDVLLDLLPSSKNDKNDGEKTFPPSSSLLSILAPRQPLPELRAAAAVPRSEVLLFAVPPRPRARLRVPPAGAGEEAAATAAAATTTRLIAGVPQWLAAAAFEQERGGVGEGIETSSRNLLSSASLFVSPRAPRCNASGGSGGGAKGGRSRRASLAGAAGGAAAGGRSPPFSLSRSVSSVSTSSASTATTRKRSLVRASWSLRPGTAAVAVRLPGSSSPGESSAVECVVVAEAGAERGLGSWLRVSPRSSSSSSLPLPGAKKGERTLVWLWVEPAAAAEGEEGGEGGGGEEEEEGRVAAAAAAPLLSAKVPAASMATKQQQQRHRQQQQQQRHRQQQQHHHHHSRLPSFLSLPLTLPRCGAFEADVQLEYRGGGGWAAAEFALLRRGSPCRPRLRSPSRRGSCCSLARPRRRPSRPCSSSGCARGSRGR